MTTALWKAAPIALVLCLPTVSSARAGDPPTARGQREIVADEDRVVTLDDDDAPVVVHEHQDGRRSFLGVELIEITPELRAHFGAPRDAGVLVAEVEPDSPAAKAGVSVGDVIMKIEGDRVESARGVSRAIRRKKSGDAVKIEVERGKAAKTLTATVAEKKGREFELGELPQRMRDHDWAMRDFDIQLPRIGRLESLDRLQEKLDDIDKRLRDLEKKLR